MSETYLLGIDIGTSSVKVVLTDRQGRRLGEHSRAHEIVQERPGYVEQDAEDAWWRGAKEGILRCLEQSRVAAERIAGICASGMVPSLCPLDADGNVIRRAILYRDNRAIDQTNRLNEKFGPGFTLQDVTPKLLWLKENEPERYGRIAAVLNAHSYVAYRLTGAYSADTDIAAIFGEVYDIDENRWRTERMAAMGLNPSVLPPLYRPTDVVGTVTAKAAAETGLSEGTPVIAGTGDSYTILVGTGTIEAGEGLIYLGTAATFLGLTRSLDELRGALPFLTGEARFLGNVLMGGEITRWFRETMRCGDSADHDVLEDLARSTPRGAEGLYALPHLLGERTPRPDPLAKGVLFGLTNTHTAGHLYRALLEGVAYALRESYENAYMPLKRLVVGGGGGKSALWRQILADVLGRELEYMPEADNAMGTAYLAGLALGVFGGFRPMKEEWLRDKQVIVPDPAAGALYDGHYGFYKQLNAAMGPLYALAAQHNVSGGNV